MSISKFIDIEMMYLSFICLSNKHVGEFYKFFYSATV